MRQVASGIKRLTRPCAFFATLPRSALLIAVLLVTHSCWFGPPIEIETSEPVVTRRYLGKEDLPQHTDFGNAWTIWTFPVRAEFDLEEMPSLHTGDTYVFKIKSMHIKLGLEIIMKLPFGVRDKLLRHEESHVEMTEAVYKEAPQIAQNCAQSLLGTKLIEHSANAQSARAFALREARVSFSTEYKKLTADKADALARRFDKITVHGTNNIPDPEAKKRAIEQYNANPML
jgi:hypothetical protein